MSEKKKPGELREVTEELIGMEGNKVVNTFKGLTFQPGLVADYYLKGGRDRFLSPVVYFFALLTLQFLIASLTGFLEHLSEYQMENIVTAFGDDESLSPEQVDLMIDQFSGFILFLMSEIGQKLVILPIGLFFTWLIYRKLRSGIKPHIWIALYTFGHISLISILLSLLWNAGLSIVAVNYSTMVLSVCYWIYATGRFYKLSVLKAIWTGLLFYVVYLVFFALVGAVFGAYIGFQVASMQG